MLGVRVKEAGKRMFAALGLEIRKRRAGDAGPPPSRASLTGALQQLTNLGFRPKTVIDVGVAYQTAQLYEAVPDAQLLVIEPLAEFEPFLQKICERYKAQYTLAAAGEAEGTATLNVHPDQCGSSFLKEVEGALVDAVPR